MKSHTMQNVFWERAAMGHATHPQSAITIPLPVIVSRRTATEDKFAREVEKIACFDVFLAVSV